MIAQYRRDVNILTELCVVRAYRGVVRRQGRMGCVSRAYRRALLSAGKCGASAAAEAATALPAFSEEQKERRRVAPSLMFVAHLCVSSGCCDEP